MQVRLISPDLEWGQRFAQERERLLPALGDSVAIAHVGSTAIANLPAKPIIDILVGHTGNQDACLSALVGLGYVLEGKREGHAWLCWPAPERREVIIHLVIAEGPVWQARLAFRDRLNASEELRAAYLALKRQLAELHPDDLNAYTAGKAAFVRAVVAGQP